MTTTVGQFTVPASAGVQAAASQIANSTQTGPQAAGVVPAYRQGKVISYDAGTPPTCTVTFDGTTNVAGVGFLESYFPVANDIVVCITLNGTVWILGQLAAASPLTLTVPALSVSGSASFGAGAGVTGTTSTTSLSIGGHTACGINGAYRSRQTTLVHSSSGSFIDIDFDQNRATVQDDDTGNPIYTNPYFRAPVAGIYLVSMVMTSPAVSTVWQIRWITSGGAQVARMYSPITNLDIMVCTSTMIAGVGTQVKAQVSQNSGGSATIAANASGTPFSASFNLLFPSS